MEKVKAFFNVFVNSLLPHYPYYHTLLKTKFADSFKYFFYMTFFMYLIFLLLYVQKYDLYNTFNEVTKNFSKSLQSYPSDLTITLTNGKLTTNYDRPYFMWMDYKDTKMLLFVVDPNANEQAMNTYKPISLITGSQFIARNLTDTNTYTVSTYDGLSTKLDKSKMMEFEGVVSAIIKAFILLMPLFVLIIFPLIAFGVNFFYALVTSLIVYFFARTKHKRLSYGKTLQLAFHAITLPLLVNYALGLVNLKLDVFPFAFFMLLLVFVSVAVYESHLEYPKQTTTS
jgi:hypothetical protein